MLYRLMHNTNPHFKVSTFTGSSENIVNIKIFGIKTNLHDIKKQGP